MHFDWTLDSFYVLTVYYNFCMRLKASMFAVVSSTVSLVVSLVSLVRPPHIFKESAYSSFYVRLSLQNVTILSRPINFIGPVHGEKVKREINVIHVFEKTLADWFTTILCTLPAESSFDSSRVGKSTTFKTLE